MNLLRNCRHAAIALGCLILLAGCASKAPRPDALVISASAAIEQAEAAGARQYEPVLLNQATNKAADARELIDREQYQQATRLLEQATVDAQLAAASSETQKSRQAAEEISRNIEALRMELNENAQ
ncbi:DUF4398 domain-containing protein [Marinobacter sp. X15-166B]|uniref:DUF4398 domain-containing protein n=1 Tax=Marinobacter sp. X15-166B TaxID=1897620 RepID=UPI00085BD610|nr:DUF4398 domain-containing protein [Marinobacter sp. X15-166B]OEY65886.1 hypothetical protein BG841_05065 [Marinobacter sp. X15-166B]